MSIQSIQSKYPTAVWYDSNHGSAGTGTVDDPYSSMTTAMTTAGENGVVAIKNGTHQTNKILVSQDNLTFVGESTEAVLSSATSSTIGCSFSADNQDRSFTLETSTDL